jgi:hypothetical protein
LPRLLSGFLLSFNIGIINMALFNQTNKMDPIELFKWFQERKATASTPEGRKSNALGSKPGDVGTGELSPVEDYFASLWEKTQQSVEATRKELAPTMEEAARRSAEEVSTLRSKMGITDSRDNLASVVASIGKGKDDMQAEASIPVPLPIPEGKGLMSPPEPSPMPESGDIEVAEPTKSSVADLIYTDFVSARQEGDEAHVGQDSKNITLAGGVVPDGLIYKGSDFKQNTSEVSGFDKSQLDTSKAYMTVGSKTIRRSDFESDKDFAKGVIKEFEDQAKEAAGNSWDTMSEGSKKAVVKIGWNKGANWYKGNSATEIYKELAKANPNPDNLYNKILVGSTVKGGGASIGIAKARANAWNETISATGGKEITKIEADNTGANTAFKYYDKEGNLLYTEQTTRANSKYESKTNSVFKDTKGKW